MLFERARTLDDPAPSALRMLEGGLDADALFKEARRRRRLRWLFGILIAVVVLGLVVAIGTAYGFSGGAAPSPHASGGTASEGGYVYTVKAASMEPTLVPGDQVEVTRGTGVLKRGDLVDFKLPIRFQTPGINTMIKRIIGLPGETISSSGTTVLINGTPLSEPYLEPNDAPGPVIASQVIPPGEYFVLGDNRTDSLDSSYLGPIPSTSIIGVATRITAPPSRAGPIPGTSR
jgi:signal peptidase I